MTEARIGSATDAAAKRPERRRSERAPVDFRVDYRTGVGSFSAFARNIGEGGLFIVTEDPLTVGTVVSLQFELPASEEPVEVGGRVVWTVECEPEGSPGMGIVFDNLDDSALCRIQQLMRELKVEIDTLLTPA